jgi:hypothetical protein
MNSYLLTQKVQPRAVVPLGMIERHKSNTVRLVRILFLITFCSIKLCLGAQQIDSIYFNLYTDSLKKGTHNYINVDGKLSNGKWMPLTDREVRFSASACKFSGNELIIPADFGADKITIKAVLKSNPNLWLEKTIWIKKKPDPELPTLEEVMKGKGKEKQKPK